MTTNFQDQVSSKSDSELLDIFVNADDYQEAFVNVVEQELIRRDVNLEKVRRQREVKSKHTQEQYGKGRQGNEAYIVLSFISAFLGGLLGIIAGYIYSQSKHRDNAGIKHYVYDAKTRELGRIMMIVGILVLLVTLIWRLS